MTWRLAKSLETLRSQINRAAPGRSKASDGTIGDPAHAARASDHNPNKDGVVTALDITHDPAQGVDIQKLADALVASKDARIKYIICNGRIVSGSGQKQPAWQWRKYSGSNAHTRHVHISVKSSKAHYDDTRDWSLPGRPATPPVKPQQSVLKRGSKGAFVVELQRNLAALGYAVGAADGIYGEKTEAAVKAFQKARGLAVDGWAGPRTLEAIGKAVAERSAKPKIEAAREDAKDQAADEVKKKTGLWQWLTGLFGGGGVGTGLLWGVEWQTLAVMGGITIVVLILIVVMRRQIVSAVRDIREGLA